MGPDDLLPGAPGTAKDRPPPLPADTGLLADRGPAGRRAARRSRPVAIGAAALAALLVLGGIGFALYHITRGPARRGVSRLSLPGVSVAVPRRWQELSVPANEHAVAAEPSLDPPCPDTLFGGPPACQDALALTSVPDSGLRLAVARKARTRFTVMRNDIRRTTVLRRGAASYGGCPAYMTQWRVRWARSLVTIEELIVVKTGVRYAHSNLESVFIRFADTPGPAPRAAIGAITSSIRCRR